MVTIEEAGHFGHNDNLTAFLDAIKNLLSHEEL
jgi:hypothetical protein